MYVLEEYYYTILLVIFLYVCMYDSNMPPNCISQWDDKASKGHVN
jgi:hypothetical protein